MAKEKLVYVHSRWEIARIAINRVTGKEQWERRDGSYICDVDTTEVVEHMPKKPKPR
jgi:hypothetical protein